MNGHTYVKLRHSDGREVEFAFPAIISDSTAISLAESALPDWHWPLGAITWRASFDHHCLPGNSSPNFQSGVHPPPGKAA
jgi:hypothetical protein